MQLYAAAYEGTANVHLQFMNGQMPTPRYTMSIIVSSYQHCDEQQFQTLSCALYTFVFSNKARFNHVSTVTVTRLHSCSGKKIGVSLACIFFHLEITLPHLTSPHLTSPHLTSPHLTSPHLTSPHLTSPHLTSPHLTSPHLTSPHLTSPHLTSPHLTSPHLTSPHLTSPYLTLPYLT